MSSSSCPYTACFDGWLSQQRRDLDELVRARNERPHDTGLFRALTRKCLDHHEEYNERRRYLAREDSLWSFSSEWCTSFESSFLWMGGLRATLPVQLVYTLCGMQMEAHLADLLQGMPSGHLGDLGSRQLMSINDLHCRTVKAEETLSTRLTRLQEAIGDDVLFEEPDSPDENDDYENGDGMMNGNAHHQEVLEKYERALADILREADRLRLKTLREMVNNILNPVQAVDFLVAAQKLHLSMRGWGERKYTDQGRFRQEN